MTIFSPPAKAADFYTQVRNTSGKAMYFGFLPPHGMRLAVNEEVTIFGDLLARLQGADGRKLRAFNAAVDSGKIKVIYTSKVYTKDASTKAVKTITTSGGAVALADPASGAYTVP